MAPATMKRTKVLCKVPEIFALF